MKTYSLCALLKETGEIIGETKIPADVSLIIKFIENTKKSVDSDVQIKTGYEAGCLGYSLYWQLAAKVSNVISWHHQLCIVYRNKVVKNDRRDAKNGKLTWLNGTYKSVYDPTDEDVEIKEYKNMNDFKIELRKVKQHINAFLLRFGHHYPGKSKWIPAHIKWLKELELSGMYREILDEYLSQLEILSEKIERFKYRLEELSQKETYNEKIGQLRCIKGIDTTAAMTMHAETSDFDRFPTANAFASYCRSYTRVKIQVSLIIDWACHPSREQL